MNHRDTEFTESRTARRLLALCALCLCGLSSFAAQDYWPVGYNNGVTAYRSNDFSSATTAFEQATASPDRTLQQRAYYNLGNTAYRLGEADPTKAQPLWERAVKNYETALALDPKDGDAKFNHEFVKKKLEELKKQQEQQQNQKNRQEEKKDNQQQQQQAKQQEQPQSQEQKQDQQQQQQNQQKPKESKPQEQQAQPQQLDKQEAKALLDDLRENEQNWNFFPEVQMKGLKDSGEPAKDW